MKLVFCMWGIPSGGAVETAWKRLASLFGASSAEAVLGIFGNSFLDVCRASWRDIRKERYVVCATVWQVLLVWLFTLGSPVKIIYWVQGLVAEEAYLKNGKKVNFNLLRLVERVSFFLSYAYIYVSPFMEDFFGRRYSFSGKKPRLIVPCVSDLSSDRKVVRKEKSYCYLGGMSAWQRFDAVVGIMNDVVRAKPDVKFNIGTKEIAVCKEILKQHATQELLAVSSVQALNGKAEVEAFLSGQQFGFLIRDDNSVNNVASPIKLAEYLSCGVNVITTNALRSYEPVVAEAGYVLSFDKHGCVVGGCNFEYKGEGCALNVYKLNFSYESAANRVGEFLKFI